MEGESEITVVVENPAAVTAAIAESDIVHAEARVEVAEIEAARDVTIAEAHAETAVAVAEIHSANNDEPPAWALALVAQVSALTVEVAELRTAAIVEEIEEAEEEEAEEIEEAESDALESGEVPASVTAAEALEPAAPGVVPVQETARKRHLIRI